MKVIDSAILLLLLNIFPYTGCATNDEQASAAQPVSPVQRLEAAELNTMQSQSDRLKENWGIEVDSARLSAGGYMIDFRYRVVDAVKAAPILDRSVKPYMVDQASGATFIVPAPPKVGQLRSGKIIKEGRNYFIMFANPAQYVKPGNMIAVVIGECEIKDIVVQ